MRGMSPIRAVSATAACLTVLLAAAHVATAADPIKAPLQPFQQRRMAPDFALKDANGKTIRLSDYRGRVVLLDFWATKCGGCVEEIPWFVDITTSAAAKGLVTVGVSEDIEYENLKGPDEAWTLVNAFVRDHAVPYRF